MNRLAFKVVGVIQIVLILVLAVGIFAPLHDISLVWGDFEAAETSGEYLTEGRTLKSGAYTVRVCYDIPDLEGEEGRIDDILGTVSFRAYACPAALHAGSISLNSQDRVNEQTIWVDCGAKITDFKVCVEYREDKDFTINSIELTESRVYRVVRFFGFLALFIFVDAIVLFFFTDFIKTSAGVKGEMLILLGILLFSSILVMSNVIYYGHDLDFHINRIASIANGLREGQFPVRMHSDMLNGYGYPNSLFYGETLLYIPAVLYLLKVPLGACYQIYILLNNFLTIVFSYICFKAITGRKRYALLGVFLYTLSSYRLVNVYTRAAVGEYTAMTFLPLIVLGLWNILTQEKLTLKQYIPLCIGISGVVQSHVITTEISMIFIALTCVVCIKRVFEVKRLIALVKAAFITLSMNLWFIIPLLDYMSTDIYSKQSAERIQEQGLYPVQWIGLFFAGTGVSNKNTTNSEMGLSLGIGFFIGIAIAVYLCNRKDNTKDKNLFDGMKLGLGLGLMAIILTSRFFPWDSIAARSVLFEKIFCVIQYPWRYLAAATICFTVSTVLAVQLLERCCDRIKKGYAIALIVFVTLISIGYYYYDYSYRSTSFEVLSESNRNIFYIGNKEYLLVGTDVEQLHSRAVHTDSDVQVKELNKENGQYIFEVKNDSDCVKSITIPVLNYDNYRSYDSDTGETLEISTGENNCIAVEIPSGYEGNVIVEYHPRTIWRICEIVSASTIILLIGYYVWCFVTRRRCLKKCEA